MGRLTRDGAAEPISRDQISSQARVGTGKYSFSFPVQLTTSRIIGNPTRLIYTLATGIYMYVCHNTYIHMSRSTIGGAGDMTTSSPGWSPKQPLPRVGLNDLLYDRQACPEFNSFHQGVGQICPREGLFSCRPLGKRGQICDIPDPPNR